MKICKKIIYNGKRKIYFQQDWLVPSFVVYCPPPPPPPPPPYIILIIVEHIAITRTHVMQNKISPELDDYLKFEKVEEIRKRRKLIIYERLVILVVYFIYLYIIQ